jgi:hypothetical protein
MTVTLFKKGITARKADPKKIISEKKRNKSKKMIKEVRRNQQKGCSFQSNA